MTQETSFKKANKIDLSVFKVKTADIKAERILTNQYEEKLKQLKEVAGELNYLNTKGLYYINIDKLTKKYEEDRGEEIAYNILSSDTDILNGYRSEEFLESTMAPNMMHMLLYEYKNKINKFFGIYESILSMDTRSESEKSKGYKGYVEKILSGIDPDTGKKDANIDESFVKTLLSYFSPFEITSTTEKGYSQSAEKFFYSMQSMNRIELAKLALTKVITETSYTETDSSDNGVLTEAKTESDCNKIEVLEEVNDKLDRNFDPNGIHNKYQSKVKAILDITKTECLHQGVTMGMYLMETVSNNDNLKTSGKYEEYAYRAETMISNCEHIFQMETIADKFIADLSGENAEQAYEPSLLLSY